MPFGNGQYRAEAGASLLVRTGVTTREKSRREQFLELAC